MSATRPSTEAADSAPGRRVSIVDLTKIAGREHRLRTAVCLIAGWAVTLDEQWQKLPDRQRRDGAHVIRRRALELMEETERLLAEARVEAEAVAVHPVTLDLASLLSAVALDWDGASPDHPVRVDCDPDMSAVADASLLVEVLGHLIDNAIKYSPRGGEISLRAHRDWTWVVIEVRDHGVGIPQDINIFAPFQRPEGGRTAGAGLGLNVAREMVERMGGVLDAHRNHHRGSTFRLRLPARQLEHAGGRLDNSSG